MIKFSDTPKEVILQAAKEIALEESISAINMRSVASKCSISVGTVYNSFATKSDLLFAVVEDFWKKAFIDIHSCLKTDKDFIEKIEELYRSLFLYLNRFQENWLEQLSLLKENEKSLGKQKQYEYFAQVQDMIVQILFEEEAIHPSVWTDTFTKEKLAELIFNYMLDMLRRREEDIRFFIETLKRILSI